MRVVVLFSLLLFFFWREMSYPTILMTNSYAFMAFFLFRSMESEYYSTGASTKEASLWSNDMRRMLFMRSGRGGWFVWWEWWRMKAGRGPARQGNVVSDIVRRSMKSVDR